MKGSSFYYDEGGDQDEQPSQMGNPNDPDEAPRVDGDENFGGDPSLIGAQFQLEDDECETRLYF